MNALEETEHYRGHPAMARGQPALFILSLLLAPVGIGIIALLFWWIWNRCATLTVTDKRVVFRKGILFRHMSEVLLRDIRNVQIAQGPLQRLGNAGNIGISSAGQADIEIQVPGILDPEGVKRTIDQCRGA